MMRYLFTCFLVLPLIFQTAFSQPVFQAELIPGYRSDALNEQFKQFDVYELDIEAFDAYIKSREGVIPFHISFGSKYRFNLELMKNVMLISPDFKMVIAGENGTEEVTVENNAYKGWNTGTNGGDVALTIDENFLYGLVEVGNQTVYIEPLNYFDREAPDNQFVVYLASQVIFDSDRTCALIKMDENVQKLHNQYNDQIDTDEERSQACKELELAMASDWLMHQDHGGCGGVQSHVTGILNNVQTNWDDEFNDEIQILQVTHFCSNCSTCDPWTSSTNAGTLLSSFTSWAPGGFGVAHDMGQLWTDRNFNGGTVGIAWLNSVCGGSRYHCNQDYTGNATSLRVLTSHEMGHNFAATHDSPGAPFIMAPSVNSSNSWSGTSQSQINNKIATSFCLGGCTGGLSPPDPDFDASATNICEEDFVQFTDQSTNSPDEWNWYFEGGIPTFSSQQNPIVQYLNAGDFEVELEACNSAGCNSLIIPNYIHVEPLPEADFTHFVSPDPTDRTVTFTNFSTDNAAYDWNFGDGFFSTEENPIHEYLFDGEYTVTLTVTNQCGVATFQQTVVVATLPEAGFSAVPEEGCTPLIVEFINESSPNSENFFWEFEGGDPMTSDEPNPVVTFEDPGSFTIRLTVSNSVGSDFLEITDMIFVDDIPEPDFNTTIDGLEVEFENLTGNGDSFGWDFGDGSSSVEENPSHTYQSFGTYTIIFEVSNECGAATIEQEITVTSPPEAGFTASAQSGCAPFEVTFTDQSTTNTEEWRWVLPGADPDMSFDPSPTVTYDEPGTYPVTLIATNDAGADTLVRQDYIVVDDVPDAGFTLEIRNLLDVEFSNTTSDANSYLWDFGDGQNGTEENPVHTYDTDGIYVVQLIATNDCGNDTITQEVVIVTLPEAGFNADARVGCAPMTVSFFDESTPNTTEWSWTFDGGNPNSSAEQDPVVTYDEPGTYPVELTVSNSAGDNTATRMDYITVVEPPEAVADNYINNTLVQFDNMSTSAVSYFWDFGDGETSTDENPLHVYDGFGTYLVMLIADNGVCPDTTYIEVVIDGTPTVLGSDEFPCPFVNSPEDCSEFDGIPGSNGPADNVGRVDITSSDKVSELMVFPNPNNGLFRLRWNGNATEPVNLRIFSALGNVVYQKDIQRHDGFIDQRLELNDLQSGAYMILVRQGDDQQMSKIIVEKR